MVRLVSSRLEYHRKNLKAADRHCTIMSVRVSQLSSRLMQNLPHVENEGGTGYEKL
jgi:hypothetical protein